MTIQPLQYEDIPHLEALQPPGWGDIRLNFEYHAQSPTCDPVKAVVDNTIVGVGTTIRHLDTAWLAMIIVHPSYRSQGVGKAITKSLIEGLDTRIFKTIQLDATDLGYPVYLKNGFEVQTEYMHFRCENFNRDQVALSPAIVSFHDQYRNEMLEMDRRISGESRAAVINLHI